MDGVQSLWMELKCYGWSSELLDGAETERYGRSSELMDGAETLWTEFGAYGRS